ncbi:arginine--tRNA ligase [Candidatus Micrarchaeota archaeon]|nr:arginine--tRNA ligase [Candidatus Micrarchaeota archaeon]
MEFGELLDNSCLVNPVYAIISAQKEARKLLKNALKSVATRADAEILLLRPKEAWQGDLSCSVCFELARTLKKSPKEIAEEVARKVNENHKKIFVEKCEPVNGHLNFFFSPAFFEAALKEIRKGKGDFGRLKLGRGVALVDYSHPNVGKPMHVGHIRSTILGDSIKRLLSFSGYKSVGFNYLGDSGSQVAKLVLAMQKFKDLPEMTNEKSMLDYYVKINQEIEADAALNEEARGILERIEAGDEKTLREVERIREVSMKAFERNYGLLGIVFEEVTGESAFVNDAKKRVVEAVKKGIAIREADGTVIVKLEPELPNTVLMRSNGTTLYLTRDLALADYKWKNYKFALNLYVTAAEQNLHFQQVFKTLEKLGREYCRKCVHIGFGLLFLEEGKISSREGRVVFLEDVLNNARELAKEEIKRTCEYDAQMIEEISTKVGIGAVKFALLRITPEKNISFDLKRVVSFQGDTGAYVQYTYVRASNILRKALEQRTSPGRRPLKALAINDAEKNLVRALADFPIAVESAAKQFRPHILCDYLLDLSNSFSAFYDACPVLKAETLEERNQRLLIVEATKTVLGNGLRLLGIEAPERM